MEKKAGFKNFTAPTGVMACGVFGKDVTDTLSERPSGVARSSIAPIARREAGQKRSAWAERLFVILMTSLSRRGRGDRRMLQRLPFESKRALGIEHDHIERHIRDSEKYGPR